MSSVLIRKAIESGGWQVCRQSRSSALFKIRLFSFEKIDLSEVDNVDELEEETCEGVLWLMRMEIVNLHKTSLHPPQFRDILRVVDSDGCEFEPCDDYHLCSSSEYAQRSGLARLISARLRPKILRKIAVAFQVADEDSEYSLTISDGSIREAKGSGLED